MHLNHEQQKERARKEAEHHAKHASVAEMRAEQDVKDMYYRQDKKEYGEAQQESQANGGRNAPAVPKSMLEREYNKTEGGYVHKAKGTYRE